MNMRTVQVLEAVNADSQFRHAARRWTIELMIGVGEDRYIFDVLDGHVRRFELTEDLFQSSSARLVGTDEDWRNLLEAVPVPFYQDFIGAWFNHGFEISGDLRSVFAHYWALLRLLQVMRNINAQAKEQ
ncbi:MAG: hypothetical protein AB7I40_16315 [Nocardioides sp.]